MGAGFFYGATVKDTTALSFLGTCLASDGGTTNDQAPFGWVRGKAITTGVNRYQLVILPEAMKKAYAAFMTNPVLALGHRIDADPEAGLPIGTVLELDWDGEGNTLFLARFANTPEAQKVRGLYNSKDMRAFSIQFRTLGRRDPTADDLTKWPLAQQIITDLDLIEISCCVVGVDAGALATTSQSLTPLARPRALAASKENAMKLHFDDAAKQSLGRIKASYNDCAQAMGGVASALEELSSHAEAGPEGNGGSDPASSLKKMSAHMALVSEAMKGLKANHQAFSEAAGAHADGTEPDASTDPADTDPDGADGDEPTEEQKQALLTNLDEALKGAKFITA